MEIKILNFQSFLLSKTFTPNTIPNKSDRFQNIFNYSTLRTKVAIVAKSVIVNENTTIFKS